MCMRPGQGDLLDGEDADRNAQIARLKTLFYDSPPPPPPPAPGTAADDYEVSRLTGTIANIPLCRWPWEILPHHQKLLVVHEPQYTHMFETVLSGPEPHCYVHLMLPGGTANLDNDEYALRPGTAAPLHGTLMQIVATVREQDSRLSLLVQGLSRVVVLRATQTLPYSRADVQLLPDLEALRGGARASRRWLRDVGALKHTDVTMRRRLALAAAMAEEATWRPYQFANASVTADPTPKLCELNASSCNLAGAADEAEGAVRGAMKAVLRSRLRGALSSLLGARIGDVQAALASVEEEEERGGGSQEEDDERAADAGVGRLYPNLGGQAVPQALEAALTSLEDEAVEAEAALSRAGGGLEASSAPGRAAAAEGGLRADEEEAEEELTTLMALECQVWLELDALTRAMGYDSVPEEILTLLPPPPAAGWPLEFRQQRAARRLTEYTEAAESLRMMVAGMGGEEEDEEADEDFGGFVQVDHDVFPSALRAARLSYIIWAALSAGAEDGDMQPVLEAPSTSERLRLALLRMRELLPRVRSADEEDDLFEDEK